MEKNNISGPSPGTLDRISQKELIALLGFTRQWVFVLNKAGMPRNSDRSYTLSKVVSWLPGFYYQSSEKKFKNTLGVIRKKLQRNVRQLERFIDSRGKKKVFIMTPKDCHKTIVP